MRILLIASFMLLYCCKDMQDKEISNNEKKMIINRIKGKEWFNDTIRFNTFKEYYSFIPNLKLPFTIGDDKFPTFEYDSIKYFLSHSNFGLEAISVEAKVLCDRFVLIIFGGQTSGNDYSVYTFDYQGNKIDNAIVFLEEELGPIKEEKCLTKIDSNLNINMIYHCVRYKSFDSSDTLTEYKNDKFQILSTGKIQKY